VAIFADELELIDFGLEVVLEHLERHELLHSYEQLSM
jgi:hypothetical protein